MEHNKRKGKPSKKTQQPMEKVIQHLKELSEKYDSIKQTYNTDLKLGFKGNRKMFDPVFYDEEAHNDVILSIRALTALSDGKTVNLNSLRNKMKSQDQDHPMCFHCGQALKEHSKDSKICPNK